MHTLTNSPSEFYKKAVSVARHYGFVPFEEARTSTSPTHSRSSNAQQNRTTPEMSAEYKKLDPFGGDFSSLMSRAIEKSVLPAKEPILLFDTNLNKKSSTPKIIRFSVHIIGTSASIAEAIIIKTAHSILEENGIARSVVHLNSIGDRDSSAKFAREVNLYLRKNTDDLPDDVREALKDDVFLAITLLTRKRHSVLSELPRSVEFLTSSSRKHLREVIEFVETAGIPYELDDLLLGHRDCYSQTLFEIHSAQQDGKDKALVLLGEAEGPEPYARGGRFDEFSKRMARTATPTVSMALAFTSTASKNAQLVATPLTQSAPTKKPLIVFIPVGFEAKLRSISVIETFRKAHITFCQCLQHDKLTDQLAYAEQLSVPFTIIMGQKEALGNNVIVRNSATRAQQTVSIDLLPSYIKGMQRK